LTVGQRTYGLLVEFENKCDPKLEQDSIAIFADDTVLMAVDEQHATSFQTTENKITILTRLLKLNKTKSVNINLQTKDIIISYMLTEIILNHDKEPTSKRKSKKGILN